MPLFFLPYLYAQLVLSSATGYWTEANGQQDSPSLPSPETIAQVLR